MKVGFIGLVSMGAGMSRNLIKAGHDLVVYNRTRSLAQEMRSLGAKVADTASEAAVGVEALITMLADDGAVQDVMFEPGAAIESLPEGGVHISMSTISVDLSRRLAKSHADKHQNYIAAPVFGRPDAAATGKLFIVSAGPSESIEKCRSLFAAMGQKTFMINEDAPAANLIKLSGNFLTTTVIESLAEGFALMRKAGVDPQKFLECSRSPCSRRRSTKPMGASSLQKSLSRWVSNCRLDSRTTGCFWRRPKRLRFPCQWPALCMIDS